MRTIKWKWGLMLIVLICAVFLSGCSDAEWELIEEFFVVWAEDNGLLVDGEWQPEGVVVAAVQNTIDDVTNSDASVQLDGLDVVRDIEKAEELSDEALKNHDPAMLELPKEMRPNDWAILEKEAVIWGGAHNSAAAQSAISESDELLRKHLEHGGSCLSARREQLETRLTITWDEIMNLEGGPSGEETATELREIHEATRKELQAINHRQYSDFCYEMSKPGK